MPKTSSIPRRSVRAAALPFRSWLAVIGGASLLAACGTSGTSGTTTGTTTTTTGATTTTSATTSTTTGTGGAGGATTTTGSAGGDTGPGGTGGTATGTGGTGGTGGIATTTTTTAGTGGATTTTTTGVGGNGGMGGTGGVATTTTTTTATTGGQLCVPGTMQPCYTGPANTANKGICKGGMETCDMAGAAFGPCMGEVLPMAEDCLTAADENCDGATPPCPGTVLWSKQLGSATDDEGNFLALDPAGNLLLATYGSGSPDFGCGALQIGPTAGAALVKYTSGGTCLWNKSFAKIAPANNSEVKTVATDSAGNVYVGGIFFGSIDVGGGTLISATPNEFDVFVAKLDPNGNHLWSKKFGSSGIQIIKTISTDSMGNVVLIGSYFNTINLGGQLLTSAGNSDVFVAKLDTNGNHLWSKSFGDGLAQGGFAAMVDVNDNITVIGSVFGTINLGGGVLTSMGQGDIFLGRFDKNGVHVWSKRFGNAADQSGLGLASDVAGNFVAVGTFSGTLNFGGQDLTSMNVQDAWIAKFTSDGNHLWSKSWGGPDNQQFVSVGVDPLGNIVTTGYLAGSADFGGGQLVSAGLTDILVVKYDASGNFLWDQQAGNVGTQLGRSVVVNAMGESFVTGVGSGATEFGNGVLPGPGGEDIFIVKYAP